MAIEKGRAWGASGVVPSDRLVTDDVGAAAAVAEARRRGGSPPVVVLDGGDLARSIGARGRPEPGEEATLLPVDVGRAVVDGVEHLFVGHLVARRRSWGGRVVAVMNAQHRGAWDVAPRAHPGDGRLDVLDGRLSPSDRWKARRRLPTGTHVPHPDIAQRQVRDLTIDLERPTPVLVDGRSVGRARRIVVEVLDEALVVAV